VQIHQFLGRGALAASEAEYIMRARAIQKSTSRHVKRLGAPFRGSPPLNFPGRLQSTSSCTETRSESWRQRPSLGSGPNRPDSVVPFEIYEPQLTALNLGQKI